MQEMLRSEIKHSPHLPKPHNRTRPIKVLNPVVFHTAKCKGVISLYPQNTYFGGGGSCSSSLGADLGPLNIVV